MQIYRSLDLSFDMPCVLALGCFDGVHLGHTKVILTAKEHAKKLGIPLAVFLFDSPVRNFFVPDSVPLITSPDVKLDLIAKLGVDIAVCVTVSNEILSMPAKKFVSDIIIKKIHAVHAVCGYNYSFGKAAQGTPELISSFGVDVTVIPEQSLDGETISSSYIRALIKEGNAEKASALLGRPFALYGVVENGQHLARTLGFPTVNIIPAEGSLLPKNGVYVSRASFDGIQKYGITNIGMRPTVNTKIMCAETHIFDFEGDLYGKQLRVEFLHFMRSETRFPNVETMAKQIDADIEAAKKYVRGCCS